MRTHTLDLAGTRILFGLLGKHADQLVWDLNAVYVVRADETTKIEGKMSVLKSPMTHEREDIFPLKVTICPGPQPFQEEGEPGRAYWVVATDERITKIEIIRGGLKFPAELPRWEVVSPSSVEAAAENIELIDCGVFIHTPVGVLPAVPNAWFAFGFRHESYGSGPSVSLVSPEEAKAMLPEGYELVPLADEP